MKKVWRIDPAKAGKEMASISDEITRLLPEEKQMAGALIFEEVFMNVAWHAYGDNISKPLKISLEEEKPRHLFTFTDSGVPFDPTTYHPGKATGTHIGGNGIRMIRQLSKKMRYQRSQMGENILVVGF